LIGDSALQQAGNSPIGEQSGCLTKISAPPPFSALAKKLRLDPKVMDPAEMLVKKYFHGGPLVLAMTIKENRVSDPKFGPHALPIGHWSRLNVGRD